MTARNTFEQVISASAQCCAASRRSVSEVQHLVAKARETIALSQALMKRVDDRLRR